LGKSHDGQNDLLIIQTLDLIQGALLLHPPSRSLFSRELYMNVCIFLPYNIILVCILTVLIVAPTRPPRTNQLPSHPIRNNHNPRMLPRRNPPKHAHIRKPRRPPHNHLTLQVPRNKPRSKAQDYGVPLLLSHARNSFDSNCKWHCFRPSNAPAQSKQACRCFQPNRVERRTKACG